ncbi:TetR/AcrR family transcriptional regulator [Bordetella sp. 2513F-2]
MATSSRSRASDSYHHGALRAALVQATEAMLAEGGLEGFTLREAARRVGVSPAAPLHHFGSAAGLLTEVAILGFEALAVYLRDGREAGSDPADCLRRQGLGYVRFALAHPGRFLLMFRKDRLQEDPRLAAAGQAAYGELERGVRGYAGLAAGAPLDDAAQVLLLGAWSTVHGYAHLALDGKFDAAAGAAGIDAFMARTLPAMLQRLFP